MSNLLSSLVVAFALMLILEGFFPFTHPESWRATLKALLAFKDGQIRFFGLCSILCGLLLLMLFV